MLVIIINLLTNKIRNIRQKKQLNIPFHRKKEEKAQPDHVDENVMRKELISHGKHTTILSFALPSKTATMYILKFSLTYRKQLILGHTIIHHK